MTEQKKKGGEFSTYLTTINDMYLPMIEKQMANNLIEFNDYAKRCVMNAMGAIQQLLDNAGLNFASDDLDQSNITTILLNVANLELNPVAQPRECYFTIRKVKKSNGKYKQMIEMGIEGDGHDAILSRFGRDVEKVYPHWLVREDDFFEYPKFNGLEMTPPKWEPKGTGEVVRVVYPILHTDKTLHFYIGERKDVMNNLMAHINNNMMNETFGICENRYNATPEQQAQIKAKKDELKAKAKAAGFDVLGMPEFDKYISPAWKENFASEQMIIRKMRNNITRKIPKQFNHPAVQEEF